MIRHAAIAPFLLACTACAANMIPDDDVPPMHQAIGACDAAGTESLVGQPASAELAAEAQRKSRARTMRWLQPGQIVTMEYRADRLNIHLDANNRVTRIVCG